MNHAMSLRSAAPAAGAASSRADISSHGSFSCRSLAPKLPARSVTSQRTCSGRPGVCRVVARFGGGGGAPRPYFPRPAGGGRGRQQRAPEVQDDGPVMNGSIRAPTLRLLAEDNSPLGIVTREEALAAAQQASLDLVLIAADAEPPVARIMNFGKFRYEQQRKKRDQVRRSQANKQEIKELKMRYNIDIGDYNVRLKQALKFLKEGDKVKVSAQFRGREMEFKELGIKLFQRFAADVAEVGVVETRAQMEGKTMQMVLIPNKAALAKAAAEEKKKEQQAAKERTSAGPKNGAAAVAGNGAASDGAVSSDDEREGGSGGLSEAEPEVLGTEESKSHSEAAEAVVATPEAADSPQEAVGTFSKPGGT